MVCLAGVVVVIVATGGAAGPAVVAGASAAIETGVTVGGIGAVGSAVGAASTATAVGASVAVGGVGGAMVGAGAAGAGTAAVAGAAAGAATGAASAGAMTATAAGILTGPIGWLVLGASEEQSPGVYTFDCWKQVLHDDSSEPSNGRLLRDVIMDRRIKQVTTTLHSNDADLPHLILENIWNEQFHIEYVYLQPSNQLATHAIKI